MQTAEYCRQIESYLCAKNDGHLIRVVGPSFEIVSGWAAQGVPLKVALRGIDRYFERYYAKRPRRRPVKIDFCEADVLDVFDEWRRAVGLSQSSVVSHQSPVASHQSLPGHLERVILRLSNARADGTIGEEFDPLIDQIARELEVARAGARGIRGEARQALIARLRVLDDEMVERASGMTPEPVRRELEREADEELAGYRHAMAPDAFARARTAAVNCLIRERLFLPTIAFQQA